MDNYSFLDDLQKNMKVFFEPAKAKLGSFLDFIKSQFGPSYFVSEKGQAGPPIRVKNLEPTPTLTPTPEITPEPTPSVIPQQPQYQVDPNLEQQILRGLTGFSQAAGEDVPIATVAALLAQAGEQLPDNIDPLLPTILALKESRGLLDDVPAQRTNPYNIMLGGNVVNYPDLSAAILGGGSLNQLGLMGLLREGGLYQDFRDSGELADFFGRFTPESDSLNPTIDEQIAQYNQLRSKYFE